MKLDVMMRISSILEKLEGKKGGFNTALLTLSTSDQQELISLAPEITVIKKRRFWKNKIIKQRNLDALIEDYNNEYKNFMVLNKKYAEKTDKKVESKKTTTYESLTSCVHDVCEIGQQINLITLCDAFHILRHESKKAIWKTLHNMANNATESKKMMLKNYIKHSSKDDFEENKKIVEFYAG